MAVINRRRRAWSGLAGDDQLSADNDVRSYASWQGYQNRDYDNRNFWRSGEDQFAEEDEGYETGFRSESEAFDSDDALRRDRPERHEGSGRHRQRSRSASRLQNRGHRQGAENRRGEYAENRGYRGRNESDYEGGYGRSYYYDQQGPENEYEYADYGERRAETYDSDRPGEYGNGRRSGRHGERRGSGENFYNYYKSFPSYRDDADREFELMGNEKAFEDDGRYRSSDLYYESRDQFRHRSPRSYEGYRRRRPNIRDRK